jgi:acetyltransferase
MSPPRRPSEAGDTVGIKGFFHPTSAAVIGASTRPDTVGFAAIQNMLKSGFTGCVYPVNPKAKSILGVRAYKSVLEIPDPVDLAIIILPAAAVPGTLDELGEKGTKHAIVISAGFKEVGGEGLEREKELKAAAKRHGIRVIGPNCLGMINTDPTVMMNASFARVFPKRGKLAFMSQSGALCTAILEYARVQDIGFSKFISYGNKADVTEIELLAALADDPLTSVILMYLEDLSDGGAFLRLAQQVTRDSKTPKPILAVKTGRSAEGAAAAASHTGSLAGADEVYDAVMEQGGVLRVETIEELFNYAEAFENQPPPQGRRIGIVTNAGGPGIMATDAAVRSGLTIPRFSDYTLKSLRNQLPPTAALKNPVDVIGDAQHDRYLAALEAVIADENTDMLLVIITPQTMTDLDEIAKTIVEVESYSRKPIAVSFVGLPEESRTVQILREKLIPNYPFPEAAVRSLEALARYGEWVRHPKSKVKTFKVARDAAAKVFESERKEGRLALPELKALEVLSAYGIPIAPYRLAADRNEAVAAAKDLGFPVVIKIASPDLLHKTDVGGVVLNLKDEKQLGDAVDAMLGRIRAAQPDARIWGVTVQKMIPKGKEIILGATRDPLFGPLLMFGLGGIYTEAFKDVAFRVAPLPEATALEMMASIRSAKLLAGFRGEAPSDTAAAAECLLRLSQLVVEFPEIRELDVNPLVVYEQGKGALAVDCRIILAKEVSHV